MKTNNKPLQGTLIVNAFFSLISAMSILSFPTYIATIMGFSDSFWLQITALGLVLFAAFVFYISLKKFDTTLWVNVIIFQDLAWVLGSVLIATLQPWGLSETGRALISVVAVIIATFAFLQNKFLAKSIVKN